MSGEQDQHFSQGDVGGENIQWTGKPAKESQIIPVIISIILIPTGIGLMSLLLIYIRINYTTYGVTDEALYKKSGVFSDKTKRVPLSKIQNTEYSRSFVEKQFGFGSVQILSAGSSGTELSFRAVEDPKSLQELINRLSKNRSEVNQEVDQEESSSMEDEEILEEVRKTRENLEEIADYLEGKE